MDGQCWRSCGEATAKLLMGDGGVDGEAENERW